MGQTKRLQRETDKDSIVMTNGNISVGLPISHPPLLRQQILENLVAHRKNLSDGHERMQKSIANYNPNSFHEFRTDEITESSEAQARWHGRVLEKYNNSDLYRLNPERDGVSEYTMTSFGLTPPPSIIAERNLREESA